MTLLNFVNYIDRDVLPAVGPRVKESLQLTDTQFGFLGSAFLFAYRLLAPVFGRLGDTRLARSSGHPLRAQPSQRLVRRRVAAWLLVLFQLVLFPRQFFLFDHLVHDERPQGAIAFKL